MRYLLIFFIFYLGKINNVYCQSDSLITRQELLRIDFVPFKYNKEIGEKEKKFVDIEYLSIFKRGVRIIPTLLKNLPDSTKTKIKNNCSGSYFTLGQLSFILIDDIESIPFFEVTGVQCDAVKGCSDLADGVLIYINSKGIEFQTKYKKYFYSKKRKEWLKEMRNNSN
jgi:hypothetical protein